MKHPHRIRTTGFCFALAAFVLLVLSMSCAPYVKPIPANKELFKKYSFQEEDLEKVAFYASNRLVLKTDQTTVKYRRKGEFLELDDDRQDLVYSLSVEQKGQYVEKGHRAGGVAMVTKPPFLKRVNLEQISVRFDIDGLGQVDMDFVENRDGFFQLAKNEKGKIVVGGKTYTCIDGCNALLMFKARENDGYRGTNYSASEGCVLGKTLVGFLILFAAMWFLNS